MNKYIVSVVASTTYSVIVKAESEDAAENKALDMEYSEMREIGSDVVATAEVVND